MASTRTTDKRRKATVRQDGEMERLGSAFFGYSETGGSCPRPECGAPSPQVKMGDVLVNLPCPEHMAEDEERRAGEERERLAAQFLAGAGLLDRQREFTLDSYAEACGDEDGREALAVARRWLADYLAGTRRNLVLWGPIGTGKTGLAVGLVRAVCESGRPARLVNFKALLDEMKDCFDRHEPTRLALGVGGVKLLVLDDLGAERPTAWACDQLLGIVDYRYERGLPTIYVSNYSLGDLARRLGKDDPLVGQRIVSRMYEGSTLHEFSGRDRRLAA